MMIPGMIYHADGELVPDTTRIIKIDRALEGRTRELWSFYPVEMYPPMCRLPAQGEIGQIGNCLVVVSDDADVLTDFKTVRNTVFHRAPTSTLADSLAVEY